MWPQGKIANRVGHTRGEFVTKACEVLVRTVDQKRGTLQAKMRKQYLSKLQQLFGKPGGVGGHDCSLASAESCI